MSEIRKTECPEKKNSKCLSTSILLSTIRAEKIDGQKKKEKNLHKSLWSIAVVQVLFSLLLAVSREKYIRVYILYCLPKTTLSVLPTGSMAAGCSITPNSH